MRRNHLGYVAKPDSKVIEHTGRRGGQLLDVTGTRFGKLLALTRHSVAPKSGSVWECSCDCGKTALVRLVSLRSGDTTSCGCARDAMRRLPKKHGLTGTRTWKRWIDMRRRCYDKKHRSFRYYGARGITVCDRWLQFSSFLKDMGECPAGLTLDRIKNERGYEPGNCRWASRKAQTRNRAATKASAEIAAKVRRSYRPHVVTQQALATQFGLSRSTIADILRGRSWQ